MDGIDRQLALGHTPGLTARKLLHALSAIAGGQSSSSDLAGLFGQCRSSLQALGLSAAAGAALQAPDAARIAAERRWIEREGIQLVDATSALYPPLLAATDAAPALLYVRGNPRWLRAPQLAMVGSRRPSLPGERSARAFATQLSQAGLTITSGLAIGIDAASHEGALDAGGSTIAVLATGADRVYPHHHAALAQRIASAGALVSEFAPGAPPRRAHFPRRNRVLSGLCLGTLVIEAALRSGSLITARLAAAQGRAVFALPGSIHHPLARGCHALIRRGATLVERAHDILHELKIRPSEQQLAAVVTASEPAVRTVIRLDNDYKILLDALGFEPASPDELVERTGLPSQSVASMLLFLELEDVVGLQSGGRYVRL